jgi:hypothetical protein
MQDNERRFARPAEFAMKKVHSAEDMSLESGAKEKPPQACPFGLMTSVS